MIKIEKRVLIIRESIIKAILKILLKSLLTFLMPNFEIEPTVLEAIDDNGLINT